MSVELAIVMPVCIVMAFIVVNLMLFIEASVVFDRIAATAILTHGVSPSGAVRAESDSEVKAVIEEALGRKATCSVEVTSNRVSWSGQDALFDVGPAPTRFTCTLEYMPWPSSFTIAGVRFQTPVVLQHKTDLVVDAYRSGVVF